MKNFLKRRTYKRQMMLYSMLTILVISLIMGIYTEVNNVLIVKYNHTNELYRDLGDFYKAQSNGHDNLKNYLYTKSINEYEEYIKYFEQAKESIVQLKSNAYTNDISWRFALLDHMVTSYQEQAEKVILFMKIEDQNYSSSYEEVLKINEIIIKSSDDYYRLVTEKVNHISAEIDNLKHQLDIVSFFIVFLCIVGVLMYTFIILKKITNPIDQLVNNIKTIKAGTFDFHNIPARSEEIEVLCLALQDLSDNINRNIEYEKEQAELKNQLLVKENENLKKDELLVSSELKILQSQINPHFLFNAMNMIYQQAIIEEAQVTLEIIEKMTECMRFTLSQNTRITTLQMELNFVENYLYIQNRRFDGRICFEMDVMEKLPNVKIPAMILEPLIDNSIKHGLSNTKEDGLVTIYVEQIDDHIIIHISDNGKGMCLESLERLIMNDLKVEGQGDNLGLYNISKRLYMYFSKEASIAINSFEDCGFETIITIPIMKGR